MQNQQPVYYSIALDIAKRILNDEFSVGTKISGRTVLSSQYNVSPETIRKAIHLLGEANVVSVSQGKEVLVLSTKQAYHYVEHHNNVTATYSLRQELELLLGQKKEVDKKFDAVVGQIIGYSDRLRNLSPFNPVEVLVPAESGFVGEKICEAKLWHATGATVVAIRRDTEVIISPGPEAVVQAGDRLVVVGPKDILQRVTEHLLEKP